MLHSEARKIVLDTSVILRGIRAKEAQQNDSHSYKILTPTEYVTIRTQR